MPPLLLFLCLFPGADKNPDGPLIPPDAKFEKLWSDGEFTEGPVYGPGGAVYFSDIGNRIMRFDPASGKTTEYRIPSGRANGLKFDARGRLVACEGANSGGNPRISVTEADSTVPTRADPWKDRRVKSPKHPCIDKKGRV